MRAASEHRATGTAKTAVETPAPRQTPARKQREKRQQERARTRRSRLHVFTVGGYRLIERTRANSTTQDSAHSWHANTDHTTAKSRRVRRAELAPEQYQPPSANAPEQADNTSGRDVEHETGTDLKHQWLPLPHLSRRACKLFVANRSCGTRLRQAAEFLRKLCRTGGE